MMNLTKSLGYIPPDDSNFLTAYGSDKWLLEWVDDEAFYSACFYDSIFTIRIVKLYVEEVENFRFVPLSLDQLKVFDLVCED